MPNLTNAAFTAVKYGDAETLEILIEAGIDMAQRDDFDRTVLYNALEYPNPLMLSIILKYLPVTEMFPMFKDRIPNSDGKKVSKVVSNAIELILNAHSKTTGLTGGKLIDGPLDKP